MRLRPWDEERAAEVVIAAVYEATASHLDPGGGATQLHDLDVVFKDGRTAAVEVTRYNDQTFLETAGAAAKLDWRFATLAGIWVVDTVSGAKIKNLHADVVKHLAVLERAEVKMVQPLGAGRCRAIRVGKPFKDVEDLNPGDPAFAAGIGLLELGVAFAYRVADSQLDAEGEVILGSPARAGTTDSSEVVEMIERLAALADNFKKLAAADDRDERALFVWVEDSQPGILAAIGFLDALHDGIASLPAPRLPDFVDAVWVAAAHREARVLEYHRRLGWKDHGVIAVPSDG